MRQEASGRSYIVPTTEIMRRLKHINFMELSKNLGFTVSNNGSELATVRDFVIKLQEKISKIVNIEQKQQENTFKIESIASNIMGCFDRIFEQKWQKSFTKIGVTEN